MAEAVETRRSGRLRGDEPSFTEELSVLNKLKVSSTTDAPPIKEININQTTVTTTSKEQISETDTKTPKEQISETNRNIGTKQKKTNDNSSNKMAILLQNIKDTGTILDAPVGPSPWNEQKPPLTANLTEPKEMKKKNRKTLT